ncbi:MAG: ATP-binding protein [Chloroflexi bacterium]|nr:ATP-binding protein [Chloroflexota bacterium]
MNSKSETRKFENTYTDAPELHPNLVLGSLQLLFWLFFHPSAWRNCVARIDPTLRPDFCLAELEQEHWLAPDMQRLLIRKYIIWPLIVGLVVGLLLWALGEPRESILVGIGIGVGVSMGVSIVIGMAASSVIGVVTGVCIGIEAGVTAIVARGAVDNLAQNASLTVILIVAFGVSVGVSSSVAGNVASRETAYSLARQMGGVVVGVLVSGLAVAALLVVAPITPVGVAGAAALGVASGWRARNWRRGAAFGVVLGVLGGLLAFDVSPIVSDSAMSGMVLGLGSSMLIATSFALPHAAAERIAGPWAGAIAGALGLGAFGGLVAFALLLPAAWTFMIVFLSLIGTALGLLLSGWRPVLTFPFQAVYDFLLYRADEQRAGDRLSLLRRRSAFWDEFQRLRLPGLEDHLVLVMERNPSEGQIAMEYLSDGRQRWAAQAAQIELDARGLERCADVTDISQSHRGLAAGDLEGPASALLRSFIRVSQDVEAALRQESAYNRRLALSGMEDRLDGLLRELTRSGEDYVARFRPIANKWRQIVAEHMRELTGTVEARQEIDNPYVIGVPLTEIQEIFVGRTDVSARIEQLLLDRRRPPLLLYGQRRMGKTSLLTNLGRLLPSTVVPLFVDLQGPATRANDHAGFLYNIARGMARSAERQRGLTLPSLTREMLVDDPFTGFDEWLDQVEQVLGQRTALLTLDEFEALDGALAEKRFDETAVMGMMRHLIQHRPRFKLLLAGSHTLDELQRWSSYLINVQVVHIGYLEENETRQLVEQPVKDFALCYEPDACQRVLDLTRGHPALVQLLCAEIVALKNEQSPTVRRLACLDDVEAAVPEALNHGSFFFADIERNQVNAAELAMLRFIAVQGERVAVNQTDLLALQFSDKDKLAHALDLLVLRELIERTGEGYRFQVELIRRWFVRDAR